jgi:hypothetical protein
VLEFGVMRMTLALLSLAFVSIFSSSFVVVAPQSDPTTEELIGKRLASLSTSSGGESTDCGSTTTNKPDAKVAACGKTAFEDRKPFRMLYSGSHGFFKSAYGLAGDAVENVYEVEYDSRGLLHLALGKNSQTFDDNRIRVTTCIKPVRLGNTAGGLLACLTPINERESQLVAQQKPIETTVCAILEHPSSFNNKVVTIHGYASGNFEYSTLGAEGCADALWFAYGNGAGPPGLVATVGGGARPGSEDAEGKVVLPAPVNLVQDSNFQRFQKLMKARAEADAVSLKKDADPLTLYRVAATFTGRIDAVSDDVHAFHLKRKNTDRADFLGFGQMGLFDAEFVLQSVANDAVLEKSPPIPNPKAKTTPKS